MKNMVVLAFEDFFFFLKATSAFFFLKITKQISKLRKWRIFFLFFETTVKYSQIF